MLYATTRAAPPHFADAQDSVPHGAHEGPAPARPCIDSRPVARTHLALWAAVRGVLFILMLVSACGDPVGSSGTALDAGVDDVGGLVDDPSPGVDATADSVHADLPQHPGEADGPTLYRNLCARCHGDAGEGLTGPPLAGISDVVGLYRTIDARMPTGAPGLCTGTCADKVARYVTTLDGADPADCDTPSYPPRQLRLLTRAEYGATVAQLLGHACGAATFRYDPGGAVPASVHVAGAFNDWAQSPEDGWDLQRDPETGLFVGAFPLIPGQYAYKFVVDGRWVPDPDNPRDEPDGFGGVNSLLIASCGESYTAGLPPESRPSGFAFDNNADAGLVTAVHVEEYFSAAERLAEELLELAPCNPADLSCRESVLAAVATRLFRRSPTAAEMELLEAVADEPDGLRGALWTALVSPRFLYRAELGAADGDTYVLRPDELAAALSYMFWGMGPDAELIDAAASGGLADVAGIERQARRLLAHPRARRRLAAFALQWLGVEKIASVDKSPRLFPEFDPTLRAALARETGSFFAHVVVDGTGSLDEILTAPYTVGDERLAAHYGLQLEDGRLSYDGRRAGIFGHASVLASYAHSDQSSPILRCVFVRERLLCQHFGAQPPDAGGVPDVNPDATTRERFRQHTDNDACRSCHQYIDPVGFGFEHFDAVGRWRDTENGQPIESEGDLRDVERLRDGTSAPFVTVPDLAQVVAGSTAARDCFATQAYRFALGRREDRLDTCGLATLRAGFERDGNIAQLLVAIATSDGFRRRSP